MSNRKKLLGGSTVLLFALSYGCAGAGTLGAPNAATGLGPQAGAGLISNNAGGLISNNAGGLISNNAGGLISNNAGGLISNNAGGLISNNAGGLISNNAGGLTGVVNGPSAGLISNNAGGLISNNAGGLISNNAGGLISNNAGGLISNNAGGLISNNAGGFRVLQASEGGSAPVAGARVAVFNERGEQVSYAWSTTNDKGEYTFKRLKPSGPLLFVKAVYQAEGRQVTLMSVAPAPREAGLANVAVTPASSFVAKKINEMTRLRAVSVTSVKADSVQKMVDTIAPKMSDKAIVAAVIFPADKAAETFDFMLAEGDDGKSLAAALGATLATAGAPATLIAETPKQILPPPSLDAGTNPLGDAPAAELPPVTNPGTVDPVGDEPLPGADDPAPTTGETTPESTIKATVGTLGTSAGQLAANGSKLAIALEFGAGLGTANVSSFNAADFSVAKDTSTAPRAVTFGVDDGKQYTLVGDAIVGYTKAVSAPELSSGSDLVVKRTKAYVVSKSNRCVYEVDMDTSAVTILAGNPSATEGRTDGTGSGATFWGPEGITFSGGNLYVADTLNHVVRKVTTAGVVSTFAGQGMLGNSDGKGADARFQKPSDITADAAGNLYVADRTNNLIRKIASDATVTTISGTTQGNVDGVGTAVKFSNPITIAAGTIGGTQVLFVGQVDGKIRVLKSW